MLGVGSETYCLSPLIICLGLQVSLITIKCPLCAKHCISEEECTVIASPQVSCIHSRSVQNNYTVLGYIVPISSVRLYVKGKILGDLFSWPIKNHSQ